MNRRLTAVLWTLGIVALLVADGWQFFFQQPYYETWDMAVNSLAVGRARHFAEWYGPYSRWGFHHPGPVFFYVLASGEWLFNDVLRLTPAPYNAQVLAQVGVSTAFYGASLAVFARRLTPRAGGWIFWPLAVAAGAWHFGCAAGLPSYDFLRGPSAFTSTWGVHEIVLPFLCLLAAGASVAAGEGRDLPLLAVAAGTLLHGHVAQGLFVGPLTLLAYGGLWKDCARRGESAWRMFRGRHVAAGGVLAVFALPLVADLCRGADSNAAAIVHHLRTHHGEHKSLVKSVLYFLQFGAYTPYTPGRLDFGHFDLRGVLVYLRGHGVIYAFWTVVSVAILGLTRRRFTVAVPEERAGFLAWGGEFLCLGILLTLVWGTIQDGEMFYYNSWFNFSLYYFGLLIVLAEAAGRIDAVRPGRLTYALPTLSCAVVCALLADNLRVRDAVPETTALTHESIRRALASNSSPVGMTILEFPGVEWPVAAAVGLELARDGRPFEVEDRWVNEFGRDHAKKFEELVLWRFKAGPATVPWRSNVPEALGPATRQLRDELLRKDQPGGDHPMLDDARLAARLPLVFARDGEIDFRRGGNAPDFLLTGWSDAEPWGTWSDAHRSKLRFATATERMTAGGNVEMAVELHPFIFSTAGLNSQRVSASFNGHSLGPERRVDEGIQTYTWTIRADAWFDAGKSKTGVALEFVLPDATSPAALDRTGRSDDTRLLGVGVSRIRFRVVPAP